MAVTGILFGTYGKDIMYGTLSLNNEGLPTYGKVKCRLRSITIKDRTTFLETNSYKFVNTHDISAGDELPSGFMSDWENRNMLALAKIASNLEPNQTIDDWAELLINSDGTNRENDEFIEAHIYEGFDSKAIEKIELIENNLKRAEKLDFEIALAKFKDHNS